MRNVALVPQRNIFKSRLCVAAHYSRQTADLLAGYRIALVRHGRRPLLLFAEELRRLVYFSALQVADFGRKLIQRGSNHRQSSEVMSMPVALNHLRGNS